MKKVFLIFLSLIFIFTFQVKAITLEDITSGKFQSKDIAEVYPSADGVHYFTATNGNTRIVKCEYRTGHEVDTLFDVKTARECNLEQFDGFLSAPMKTSINLCRLGTYLPTLIQSHLLHVRDTQELIETAFRRRKTTSCRILS